MRLAGKVAIVTGGGSGIGRAIVLAYAREGCRVLAVDRKPLAAEVTATAAPGEVRALVADVAGTEGARDAVAAARTHWGRLDVLVNSVAVQLHGEDARCHEVPDHVWETTLRVNLGGPFLVSRAAIPEMLRGGGGSIVNIASPTGLLGRAADYTAYSTSKGGLISLTRVIAVGYARDRIRCNAIVPGPTETPLIADLLRDPAERARLEATPMGRIGRPEDLTGIATYLASDESAFATGALFTVDGGWMVM